MINHETETENCMVCEKAQTDELFEQNVCVAKCSVNKKTICLQKVRGLKNILCIAGKALRK